MEDVSGWDDAERGIGDALARICEVLDVGTRADPAEVQRLLDMFLDRRPARSALLLEQRVVSLCRAVEELGPGAREADVLARACGHADRWN